MNNVSIIIYGNVNKLVTSSFRGAKMASLAWHQSIQSSLETNGMGRYFIEQHLPFTNNVHSKFYQRLVDQFHKTTFAEINNPNSKLRSYGLLKDTIGLEKYFTSIKNIKQKINISRIRFSNHKLMIELGKHQKIVKSQHFCPFCIEDEKHFINSCKFYGTLREPLIENCALLKPIFSYLSEEQKFIFIMTNNEVSLSVAKFASLAMEFREIDMKKLII